MGLYLNDPAMGYDKAAHLLTLTGVEEMSEPEYINPESGNVAVCVVDNVMFTAAAVVFSEAERDAFSIHDNSGRSRRWLRVPVDIAKSMTDCWETYF